MTLPACHMRRYGDAVTVIRDANVRDIAISKFYFIQRHLRGLFSIVSDCVMSVLAV